jgi:outer membrane biosynthesis protein TonB
MKRKWIGLFCVVLALGAAAPLFSNQEIEAEKNLRLGDASFEKNDYPAAIESYFKAAALSTKPENLSRAYFGLSLCHFYQRDMAESVRWMRKGALVDPNKQITVDTYPKPFVDLFTQVLAEARAKGIPVVSPVRVETPPAKADTQTPPKKEEPVKTIEIVPEKIEPAKEEVPPKKEEQAAAIEEPKQEAPKKTVPAISVVPEMPAGQDFWTRIAGRFELSVHFSSWTVTPVTSLFEGSMKDEFGEALQAAINKELNRRNPSLVKGPFTSDLSFDSEGSNYGFELRYYSRGWAGTFSLGVGFEKTNIKFSTTGTAKQEYVPAGVAEATASAEVQTKPFATHFSFRWEIGSPTSRVKPFITFGLGLAPLRGTFTYSYLGTYSHGGSQETIQDAQTKDFVALSEDIDFEIPKLFVIIQLDFGLKIEIFKGLFVLGQAGIWDGFHLRGGLGYRF